MRVILIAILGLLLNGSVFAQSKSIYIFKNRYNKEINEKIDNSDFNFKEIKILLGYMIDPKKHNTIDYKSVEKWVAELFPDANQNGTLCIDLENQLYQNIRGNYITRVKKASKNEYKIGEKSFIELIKFVKELRPNVLVGVFEMPFRVYNTSEVRKFSSTSLDPILQNVDIIFPCIYIPYPADLTSLKSNYEFLKTNLDLAFSYSDRLNKPVLPFFWHLYYSSDKKTRYELMPKEELWKYVKYIENYKSKNNSGVNGIVWWDTPTPYSRNMIKKGFIDTDLIKNIKNSNPILTINDSFLYYFDF